MFNMQKVSYALNIFEPTTIAALDELAHFNAAFRETANYLRLIRRWWTMMNVKSALRGLHQLDDDGKPFTRVMTLTSSHSQLW